MISENKKMTHKSKKDNTLYILFKTLDIPTEQKQKSICEMIYTAIEEMNIPNEAVNKQEITSKVESIKKGDITQVILSRKKDNEYIKIDSVSSAYATIIEYEIYENPDKKTYTLSSSQEHKKEQYLLLAKGFEHKITRFAYPEEINKDSKPIYIGKHLLL